MERLDQLRRPDRCWVEWFISFDREGYTPRSWAKRIGSGTLKGYFLFFCRISHAGRRDAKGLYVNIEAF